MSSKIQPTSENHRATHSKIKTLIDLRQELKQAFKCKKKRANPIIPPMLTDPAKI